MCIRDRNWAWYQEKIKAADRPVKVLNLFGYTGGATLACLAAGASAVSYTHLRPLRDGETLTADEVIINPDPLLPARWPAGASTFYLNPGHKGNINPYLCVWDIILERE